MDQSGRALHRSRPRAGLLEATLARVREEQAPQLVTLVGVPGMGKSRLVWKLGELVEAADRVSEREAVLSSLAFHAQALLVNGRAAEAGAAATELLISAFEHG